MDVLVWIAVVVAVVLAIMALLGFALSRTAVQGNAQLAGAALGAKGADDVEEPGAIVAADAPIFGLLRLTREELVFVEGPTGHDTRMNRRTIQAVTVVQQTPDGSSLRNPALQVSYTDPAGQPATVVFLVKAPAQWAQRLPPAAS
ncbi:MAG: hypothetical protein QG597_668 [Actinomycetota bacterium]|nr:hypothetical protein [Actinomycetota bacterium]